MKIVGLLLIVLAGAGLGIYASLGLSRRASVLEQARQMVQRMASRIRYTAEPMETLLTAVGGEFPKLSFLSGTAARMQDGERFPVAWRKALEAISGDTHLNTHDRELLLRFGEELGRTDVQGQLSHCELYEGLLNEQLQGARKDAAAKGRLYITLGVAGGMVLALLLL